MGSSNECEGTEGQSLRRLLRGEAGGVLWRRKREGEREIKSLVLVLCSRANLSAVTAQLRRALGCDCSRITITGGVRVSSQILLGTSHGIRVVASRRDAVPYE